MKGEHDPIEQFGFARLYAFVSLAALLVAAAALAVLHRELSIRTIVEFGEQSNVTVARTVLHEIRPELEDYLRAGEAVTRIATTESVPPGLLSLIQASLKDTAIERVKIYNRNGFVLYSTLEHEIGTDDSQNPRFRGAIEGNVRSKLRYRDPFSLSDRSDTDDNLIETYVPVWEGGESQPSGVLEIYTDIDHLVHAMSRNELLIFAGIALIMVILYGFLLLVVRRLEQMIASQRQTILERTRVLEVLSTRMLAAEEGERRRVAWELHEDIAQNLSAAKIRVEALANAVAENPSLVGGVSSDGVLPLVQDAIRDVRALAMDLRPPGLDDFGLVATTRWLCREAEQLRGQAEITPDIAVRDADVPDPLKSIIFRITQQTLKRLVDTPGVGDIRVALKREKGLQLTVDFGAEAGAEKNGPEFATLPDERAIAAFWERAVLSGAAFSATHPDKGRFCYQATWMV